MYNSTEPSSKYAQNEITKIIFPTKSSHSNNPSVSVARSILLNAYILSIHLRETVVCSDSIRPVTVCKYNYIEMTKIAWNSFGKRGK